MYCRHPEIVVKLFGMDGNAFTIIGRVQAALTKAGISAEDIAEFRRQVFCLQASLVRSRLAALYVRQRTRQACPAIIAAALRSARAGSRRRRRRPR